jgi:ubiquinone/menaquinone biosynthesis C-methylase UbiE
VKEEITKYYNDLAKDYDVERFSNSYGAYIHQQENEILKKYLSEKEIEFNLDLACGTGRFLKYADYGVDISQEMVKISNSEWELVSYHGIAFFPIHRISVKLRKVFIKLDNLLCNLFLKEYSSYLTFALKKR